MTAPFAGCTRRVGIVQADTRRILVHGHRGARARRPENTIPAFRYAIEQGVDVLELDVAVTKDNVPVVSHDPLINATICSGPKPGIPIHTLTLAELRRIRLRREEESIVSRPGSRARARACRRSTRSSS